ncbi:MAG: HAMP domain-containing protein [Methyloprofundus sp.]|nr:HAMP domain-containing protein [Methyloprofundus sp.]
MGQRLQICPTTPNMISFGRPRSIYASTSLTQALGLLIFTIASVLLILNFVLFPLANRAADDMAALITILSKPWYSLPSDEQAKLQLDYHKQYQLFITDKTPQLSELKRFYPFVSRLKTALQRQTGQEIHIKQASEGEMFWAIIPQKKGTVYIGFAHARFGPHPPTAIIGTLLIGAFLTLLTSLFLVRRITRPIKTLSEATNQLAAGKLSVQTPETGPTELVVLARNFNKMSHEIAQLMSNRSILFGGISHDLRTPITRMHLAIELLDDQNNSTLIAGMRNDLQEMEQLIQQALEYVKGIDQHSEVNIEINSVLTEIIANFRRQQYIILWQETDCGVCKLDVSALRRVLCNLLSNASRYGGNAPVELTCIRESNKLLIQILDQGPGIPTDQLEAVFQPFYRLDSSRNKKTGGSGLGLAIVQQLCDIHAWKIQLLPRSPNGLIVKLEIPLIS